MRNLFVIGNGFDLSHGLKTDYCNFRNYLISKYPNAKFKPYTTKDIEAMSSGFLCYPSESDIGFIIEVINNIAGDKWSDLENSIGKINPANYMNDFDPTYESSSESQHWKEREFNKSNAHLLYSVLSKIKYLFNDWISSINISCISPKINFLKLIKEEDLFLSFNYTKTLEYIYKISDVCHIHGVQGDKNLIFGHGDEHDYFDNNSDIRYPGAEENFQDLHDLLKKKPLCALKKNKDFFDKLQSPIGRVYSYGFSFSKVDEIYIEEICRKIQVSNVIWYLNDYDNKDERDKYKCIILKCGFNGSFRTYTA